NGVNRVVAVVVAVLLAGPFQNVVQRPDAATVPCELAGGRNNPPLPFGIPIAAKQQREILRRQSGVVAGVVELSVNKFVRRISGFEPGLLDVTGRSLKTLDPF